jgi:hypothetical protein
MGRDNSKETKSTDKSLAFAKRAQILQERLDSVHALAKEIENDVKNLEFSVSLEQIDKAVLNSQLVTLSPSELAALNAMHLLE